MRHSQALARVAEAFTRHFAERFRLMERTKRPQPQRQTSAPVQRVSLAVATPLSPHVPWRQALFERDGGICYLCLLPVERGGMGLLGPTRDHLIPQAHDGRNDAHNWRLAHEYCNNMRSDAPHPITVFDHDGWTCQHCGGPVTWEAGPLAGVVEHNAPPNHYYWPNGWLTAWTAHRACPLADETER
jgi:hypothetical protein